MKPPAIAPIKTPAQYGAEIPPWSGWPLNANDPERYALAALYPTIQGEGGQAGTPMMLCRLQGCPVGCIWCDTPESWAPAAPLEGWVEADILAQSIAIPRLPWVLVTGGEPTWHQLEPLCRALDRRAYGLKRALETSGTMPVSGRWDWVTLSPKPDGALPFNPEWFGIASEVKWIVGRRADVERLEHFEAEWKLRRMYALQVRVQPLSAQPRATELSIEAVMEHPHWKLSLQTHKLVGIA